MDSDYSVEILFIHKFMNPELDLSNHIVKVIYVQVYRIYLGGVNFSPPTRPVYEARSHSSDAGCWHMYTVSKLRMRSTKTTDVYASGSGQAVLLPLDQWPSPDSFTVSPTLRGSRLLPGVKAVS